MLTSIAAKTSPAKKASSGLLSRWRRDTRGSTAAEFAIVALPFFLFCFAIMGYGLYFFTTTGLEFGVETAARQIRTGQAQTGAMTRAQFQQLICDSAGAFIDCNSSKLKIHIQSAAAWSGITPTPCLSAGGLASSAGSGSDALSGASGGASQAVLVTACYEWSVAQTLPFLMLGNMGNGSSVIQAAATFRTEPYQ